MLLDMKNSVELHRLTDSIAGLVATVTEIIDTKLQGTMQRTALVPPPQGAQTPKTVQMTTFDPIMTKRQLATHLQVSMRTIDNWCQRGHLPHYKIGKVVRFRLSDIQGEWESKLKRHASGSRF